jgi:hypothetical protein
LATVFGPVFALNTILFLALQAYIARRLINSEFAQLQNRTARHNGQSRPTNRILTHGRRRSIHACGLAR